MHRNAAGTGPPSPGGRQVRPVAAGEPAPGDGYWSPYPPLAVTTDLVVLAVAPRPDGYAARLDARERDRARHEGLLVATVTRSEEPFQGMPALPGGFLRHDYRGGPSDRSLEAAARRELREEAGLRLGGRRWLRDGDAGDWSALGVALQWQVGAYGDVGRDPRLRVVTVAYLATARRVLPLEAGGDAAGVAWLPVRPLLAGRPATLAFDHGRILGAAVESLQRRVEHSQVATDLCEEVFTVPDLHWVYEAVFDQRFDPGNFHRKVTRSGFLAEVPDPGTDAGDPAVSSMVVVAGLFGAVSAPSREPTRGRARWYRAGHATSIYPPLRPPGQE